MTTEVAAMNRTGIALAADSAVTIGEDKVYNTVNKLFTLSKTNPVGVMVYGNASIMNVPWETVIKIYRKRLGTRAFETLYEYAQDFLKYLATERTLFSDSMRQNFLLETTTSICAMLREAILSSDQLKECSDEDSLVQTAAEVGADIVQTENERITDDCCIRVYQQAINNLIDSHGPIFDEIASSQLENIYGAMSPQTRDLLREALARYFYSSYMIGGSSGVVIAGFGEHELFPKVVTLTIQGFSPDASKVRTEDTISAFQADSNFQASIIPFAQSDMIFTFLTGIDPYVQSLYNQEVIHTLTEIISEAVSKSDPAHQEAFERDLQETGEQALRNMHQRINKKQSSNYISQVISMLDSLPKDELAEMAETLVNLIAFKKKVTKGTESVGGPIDVALITKGDGFIWINRKHYFDPALNHQFFVNYNSR